MKIKQDQEQLNGDTTKTESSRKPDGALGRAEELRLGQLSGDQAKLSDRVKPIAQKPAGEKSEFKPELTADAVLSIEGLVSNIRNEQEAILAHELTHALQDQNYDLHKWARRDAKDESDDALHNSDESSSARRAVVEGQATVVMMDYLLARTGRSLLNTPGLIYRMEDPLVKFSVDTQMVHDAPMILRESGAFPYRDGLIFEGELLQAGGKKMAFAGAFARPPQNTHEVIQPRAYLNHEKLPALPFPDARSMLQGDYEVFDSGSVGELDVRALLWQFGSRTLADDLSKTWQGGAYMAFRKKSATASTTATTFCSDSFCCPRATT